VLCEVRRLFGMVAEIAKSLKLTDVRALGV
jgi:hypothetical protein